MGTFLMDALYHRPDLWGMQLRAGGTPVEKGPFPFDSRRSAWFNKEAGALPRRALQQGRQ
jgi:hypothetical protein